MLSAKMESDFKLHLYTFVKGDFLVKVSSMKYWNYRKGEGIFFIKNFQTVRFQAKFKI